MSVPQLKCYWMQGLPACGKTEKALSLVKGTEGIICDPYNWFEEHSEDFRHYKLTKAKRWAWQRCKYAYQQSITPIVVDMHVGINPISIRRLRDLEQQNYVVELVEPISSSWFIIKSLLLNKPSNRESLNRWAHVLSERSEFHKYTEVRAYMNNWQFNTLNDWR